MFPMASYHTGFPSLSSPKNPPGKHFFKTLGKEEGESGEREEGESGEREEGESGEREEGEEHGVRTEEGQERGRGATSDTKLLRE